MIGLASEVFDLNGSLYIHDHDIDQGKTKLWDISRRSTRTPTLDGGASLYDTGYSASDRNITIYLKPSFQNVEELIRLFKTYSRLILSTEDGVFIANPSSLSRLANNWILKLLIIEEV